MKAREREREKDAFDGALGELENGGDEWRICCFLPGGGTGGGGHGVAEYVPTPGERVRLPRTRSDQIPLDDERGALVCS